MARKIRYKNNYFNLAIILIGVVLLTIASSNLYKNHSANKINNSYISKYVANIQLNEIQTASVEFRSDTFLYISYTGDSNIYNFEVKLKKVLKEKELTDNFIYMNATNLLTEKDYVATINKTLGLTDNSLKKLPAILYYKDNKIVDIVDSEFNLIDTGKFVQLLEKYEITN